MPPRNGCAAESLPLVGGLAPNEVLAWRDARPVTVAEYLRDVAYTAARLPAGRHLLNLCADRYRFLVGLGASVSSARVSLLPATRTPETIERLRAMAPDVVCLCDHDIDLALPLVRYAEPPLDTDPAPAPEMPQILETEIVAHVFTSGSTGDPVPHPKTWGALVRGARAESALLGLDQGPRRTLVGTVPPQHMYGFESTALLALHGRAAMAAQTPFYPADIAAALQAVPEPRMLVTSPVHLRVLLDAGLPMPRLDLMLSATAALPVELAQRAEQSLGAPLLEIYGSTETGQVALRRPTSSDVWQMFPGFALGTSPEGHAVVDGAHGPGTQVLHDVVELLGDGRFRLLGRSADMVNIAGKRSSLAYLNHQLCSIDGVRDGAFFMPEAETPGDVARLSAFVVAPGLDLEQLRLELRRRLDPAFMPRRLLRVPSLPRNATGKLPLRALQDLARERENCPDAV